MATVSRYEFMGSWLYFWFLCVTLVGIPIAVLYLITGTIRVEEQVNDAEQLADRLRAAVR
jgi:hypothetical protein